MTQATEISSATPSGPLPVVSFRTYSLFSLRFLSYVAVIAVTVAVTVFSVAPPERLLDVRFLAVIGAYLGVLIVLFTGWRFILRKKGGVPPIRFEADHLSLPFHIHSLRASKLHYADILSVTKQGTRYARLAIEAKARSFAYPLKEFTDEDAFEKIETELRVRIDALPQGQTQLERMERQKSRTDYLTGICPYATWATGAVITVLFIFQLIWTPDHPLSIIDMGANAGALTFSGEWYRLVSANLLHANTTHIFNNLIFLFVLGPLAERMLGFRRFLLLLLATGILSQLASAWWNHGNASTAGAFSVGISGALFGILGALAVLNHQFRFQLPAGFRLAARFWWVMLGLNFVLTPLITSNVDFSAHIGGLIAGVIVGWLLCRTQRQLTAPPKPGWVFTCSLAALSLLWCVSLAVVTVHVTSPAARLADYAKMIGAVLKEAPNVILDNQLAWAVAADPLSSDAQIRPALQLSLRTAHNEKNVPLEDVDAYSDTLATLYYRTGNLDAAIATESTLRTLESTKMSQIARFLDRYRRIHGSAQLTNASGMALPRITIAAQTQQQWSLAVALPDILPSGATTYLLAKTDGQLIGMIVLQLPATTKPLLYSGLTVSLPKDFFTHPATLTLAKFDATGCACTKDGKAMARFFRMDEEILKLP